MHDRAMTAENAPGDRNPNPADLREPGGGRAPNALGVVLLIAGLLFSGPANARSDLYTLVGSTAQSVSDFFVHTVSFDDDATSVDFVVREQATVAVYFSAECQVASSSNARWLNVDIRVDGQTLAATNRNDAFCTSVGLVADAGWITASADAVGVFGPGVHTVDVRAELPGYQLGESWRLNETTLVVVVTEDDQ